MPEAFLYDITPPVTSALAVWPGDTPLSREVLCDLKRGDSITLSTLHATVHLGAHADGPNHYGVDGCAIDKCDLNLYMGPCLVIRANVKRGERVKVADLIPENQNAGHAIIPVNTSRVLIATGTYPDPTNFNKDFAGLDPNLIDHFHAMGVRLIGVDTPSVDLFDSKDLPAHRRFLANDMAILEGLDLHGVPAGVYELIALPLRLVGFDASPVRAVLRAIQNK